MKAFPGQLPLDSLTPHDLECIMALDAGINEHYTLKGEGGGAIYS